jgi:hypothetical protein
MLAFCVRVLDSRLAGYSLDFFCMHEKLNEFIHNITANVHCAWLYECVVCAVQKKFKLSSDGSDWYQEMQMRLWWCLAESAFGRSLESGSQFCVGVYGRYLASVTVKMLIYFIKKFYKFCTLNAIFKDRHNTAIYYITHQHKKGSFQSILTGHTMVA